MSRCGFTWIELLVVLAIVAVLIGLLLPAVRRVRHAAARTHCTNNLKELGLAANSYQDAYRYFPPGTAPKTNLPPDHRLSVHLVVLPFVESQPVYKRLAFAEPWDSDRNAAALADWRARLNRCPSAAEAGPTHGHLIPTTYIAVAGLGTEAATLPADDPRAGVFGYDRTTKVDQVKDGLASTALFVETTRDLGPWARGGPSTVRGVDPDARPLTDPGHPFGGLHRSDAAYSWQDKNAGSNVGLTDGSVRYLRDDADPAILTALATMAAGDAVPADW